MITSLLGGSSYSYGGGQRTRQGRPIVIRREVEQTVIPQEEEEQSGYGGEGEWAQRRGGQEEEGYGQWQYPEMQQQSPDELDEGPRRPISPQERNLRFFYHPQDCFPFHVCHSTATLNSAHFFLYRTSFPAATWRVCNAASRRCNSPHLSLSTAQPAACSTCSHRCAAYPRLCPCLTSSSNSPHSGSSNAV